MDEQTYYEVQASEAGTWEGRWADQMVDALLHAVKDLPKEAKILDIGCHTGRSLYELKNAGYTNAVGVDLIEANALEAGKKGLTVLTMNMEDLHILRDQAFDFGFMSHAIEHSLNPHKAVKEMTRVCKHGLIICPIEDMPTEKQLREQQDKPSPHTHPFYSNEQWITVWEEAVGYASKLYREASHQEYRRLGREVWTTF